VGILPWQKRFMKVAFEVASWSKDPKTKVGCVITDDQNRILSIGYNGFPRGIVDSPERYADKELKLALVQHAERNAMMNSNSSLVGSTAYSTLCPCTQCMGGLIQAGVVRVVTPFLSEERMKNHKENYDLMRQMCFEARIEVVHYSLKKE
jgi:dCMP deaminase